MPKSRKCEEELYEAELGRPPSRLPDDHPDAWQWSYRGTKIEREALLAAFMEDAVEESDVIEGQEELFGD